MRILEGFPECCGMDSRDGTPDPLQADRPSGERQKVPASLPKGTGRRNDQESPRERAARELIALLGTLEIL